MRYSGFLIAFIAAAIAAIAQTPAADTTKGYTLGPGDEVTVKVLGEPQFDFVATIDLDGRIEIPFVEKPLMAKCKTEGELRNEVTEAFKKILKVPQVSLRATQRKSRPPVSVYGEVRKQEQYDLTRRVSLLEIISYAGGVTEKSGGMVQVFRTRPPMCGDGGANNDWGVVEEGSLNVPSKIFMLSAIRDGSDNSNPEILPGDIVVVPKAAPVYVTGEVIKPGELDIPEGGLGLMQAVAMASGITREAKTKEIKVYRRKPGSTDPEVIAVNYDHVRKGQVKDLKLQPFDIVEVGKSNKGIGEIFMDILTGLPNRIPIPIRPL